MSLGVSMRSNDGWQDLTILLLRRDETRLVLQITLRGRYWDRREPNEQVGPVDDYFVTLSQVVSSIEAVRGLSEKIESWLKAPFEFQWQLAKHDDQLLLIVLGRRDDRISSVEKPALTVRYSSSRASGECVMVVDQSCLRELKENIDGIMAGSGSVTR